MDAVGVCSECGQGVCDVCAVRIGGKLYCKADADRVFGSQGGEEVVSVEGSKTGMVLTLLGGSAYLFLGILSAYSFFVTLSAASVSYYGSSSEANAALHGFAYVVIGMIATSVLVLVGGGYLSSSQVAHRKQGGVIVIVSAFFGLMVVLALPYALIPGGSTDYLFGTVAGASIVFFVVEFAGFVLVLVGGALGITRK